MLTVLMATYNGSHTLPQVLDKYRNMRVPEGGYKLVVVDNASDDETIKILQTYEHLLPLTILRIEQRGKCISLNYGLNYVDGDLIVLTDDDAIPDVNWLIHLRNAADLHPEFTIFGGRIKALWPFTPPEWLLATVPLGVTFAVTDEKISSGEINSGLVWGANMAVRREVFDAGYKFDEKIGPAKGQYRMGSETEFTARLSASGYKSWYVKEALIEHIIRPQQMDKNWIVKRAYRFGKDIYWKERGKIPSEVKLLLGAPRWKMRELLFYYSEYIKSLISFNSTRLFKSSWEIQFLKGYYSESIPEMLRKKGSN